jgi:hypothetical protein
LLLERRRCRQLLLLASSHLTVWLLLLLSL